MKLKGWTKVGDMLWMRDSKEFMLQISKSLLTSGWSVIGQVGGYPAHDFYEIAHGEVWANKKELLEATIKFMRDNPDYNPFT